MDVSVHPAHSYFFCLVRPCLIFRYLEHGVVVIVGEQLFLGIHVCIYMYTCIYLGTLFQTFQKIYDILIAQTPVAVCKGRPIKVVTPYI